MELIELLIQIKLNFTSRGFGVLGFSMMLEGGVGSPVLDDVRGGGVPVSMMLGGEGGCGDFDDVRGGGGVPSFG